MAAATADDHPDTFSYPNRNRAPPSLRSAQDAGLGHRGSILRA